MNNYFDESKLYAQKNIDNTYSIHVWLANNYTHPLSLTGMVDYSKQNYYLIAKVLNNYDITVVNEHGFNYCRFLNKESVETCIVTLNMLRIT